jgi:Tol biopolymer transport system component
LEEFVKLRVISLFAIIITFIAVSPVFGQADTVLGQITTSGWDSYNGGISGNGRFIVFESRGNIATVNPRNEDENSEIFLFDYAQRRIFQLTDTKSVLIDLDASSTLPTNIRVSIVNTRPVISNDGRWIAFSSNATTSTPKTPDATNPGNFNGNDYTDDKGENPLTQDGNLEMWLYQIPAYAPADLRTGEEIPYVALDAGTFTRVTNTPPSSFPTVGTEQAPPFVADDNHDASISDDGNVIAFVSTRDLIKGGNPFPAADNDEIFTYVRSLDSLAQVTLTGRGPIADPIYNKNPTISGNGMRVVFSSTGDNPIIGMTGGENPSTSRNEEIFVANLDANGAPAGTHRQVTITTPLTPGAPVNILDLGSRMSRDGNFIAFDSYADLANENGGTNQTSFATYVYDYANDTFTRLLPRSDTDSSAAGGDVQRYPVFTDTDTNGTPSSVLMQSRLNIMPDGTIATVNDDGLNPDSTRPPQFYRFPLGSPKAEYVRLSTFPAPQNLFIPSSRPIPSNSSKRFAFGLSLTELPTGPNSDLRTEIYYSYEPQVINQATAVLSFATGASNMPVSPTAVPTPSPTATPTPTPTPTPTESPSPSPSPTPVTPPAVLGMSPGMLAIMNYEASTSPPIVERTAVGDVNRVFSLPIELSGFSMTIGGAACGLQSVNGHEVTFVVPRRLLSAYEGTQYPVVINNQGTVIRGTATIVPTRPDLFNIEMAREGGGRANIKNVTNRVHTGEPFTVTTIKIRGGVRVPSVLRIVVTGVESVSAASVTVQFGEQFNDIEAEAISDPTMIRPGIYAFDFLAPAEMNGAGDVPVIVIIRANGTDFPTRLDDTAPKIRFL